MTSFWGYVTEGCFLLVLALWWMVNTSVEIITSKQEKRSARPRMTYPWPGTNIPVEIFYKLCISAFGFFGQLSYAGGNFHDPEGNFQNMTQLMYISIYGIFLLHSVLDLLLWMRVPVVKGSNYAAAATGFFWYALALYNRAGDFKEEKVGMMVRLLPVYILFPISVVLVLEPLWRSGSTCSVVRAYCLQTYATWCFHSAHILHDSSGFPGSDPNPSWDPTDHRNIAYSAAFFGLHLCINLVLTAATYTLTALFLGKRSGFKVDNDEDLTSGYGYKPVSATDDVADFEQDSKVKLLGAYSASCT